MRKKEWEFKGKENGMREWFLLIKIRRFGRGEKRGMKYNMNTFIGSHSHGEVSYSKERVSASLHQWLWGAWD